MPSETMLATGDASERDYRLVRGGPDRRGQRSHACVPRAGRGRARRLRPRQRQRSAPLGATAPGDRCVVPGDRLQPPLRTTQSGHRAGCGRPDAPARGRPGRLLAGPGRCARASRGPLLGRLHLPLWLRSGIPSSCAAWCSQEPPVLSLFMSTPPRPWELLRLIVRRPRTARVILSFTVKTDFPRSRPFGGATTSRRYRRSRTGSLGKESLRAPS